MLREKWQSSSEFQMWVSILFLPSPEKKRQKAICRQLLDCNFLPALLMFKPKSFKKHQLHSFLFLFFLYINITTRLVRLACYQGGGVLIVTSRTIRCSCKTATSSGLKRKGELIPLCVTATLHTVTNPFLPRRHPFLPLHL